MARHRIEIVSDGRLVRICPDGKLGDAFDTFRTAISGATFDRKRRANVASIDRVPTIVHQLRLAGFIAEVSAEVLSDLEDRTAQKWMELQAVRERVETIDRESKERTGKSLYPFQRRGSVWLARRRGALLLDQQRLGKDQAVSEPVLTPDGWRRMGELRVGDEVVGSDGQPTKIIGVFPQGIREQYRVTLEDGRTTRCGLEHLWWVRSRVTLDNTPLGSARNHRGGIGFSKLVLALSDLLKEGLTFLGTPRWEVPVLDSLDHGRSAWSRITSVESVGSEESVCIRVDAKDNLYVTNDFILTHNTVQTLIALPAGVPAVVVCPASVKGEWVGAVREWRPQIRTIVLEGRESFRWPQPGEMVITNYDILPDIHDRVGTPKRPPCDGQLPARRCMGCAPEVTYQGGIVARTMTGHKRACIQNNRELPRENCSGCHPILTKATPHVVFVLDEGHRVKNSQSQRAQRAQAMGDSSRSADGSVWILTGTPLENLPPELWCLMRIAGVATEAFPLGWKQFAEAHGGVLEYRGKRQVYIWKEPTPEAAEGLRKVSLRRLRSQVWAQLPPKQWKRVVVPIDRKVLENAERAVDHAGGLEALLALVEKEKAELGEIARMRAALATAKIPFLLEYLKDRDSQDPVVVFSMHRAPIDLISQKKGWASITGDVSAAERTKIVASFQAGELLGLACTIPAAGEGLNLSRASEAIFVDLAWKPTANEQAEDRLVHVTKPQNLVFTILEADHAIDRRVMDVCMRKRRLIGSTVDASSVTEDVATVIRDAAVAALSEAADAELYAAPGTFRRTAGSDEEQAIDAALQRIEFEDLGRQRLTTSIAEELAIVGLTDKQWILAAELIASAGRAVTNDTAEKVTRAKEDIMGADREDRLAATLKRKAELVKQDPEIAAVLAAIYALPEEKRAEVFGCIEHFYCVDSGVRFDDDPEHVCEGCDEDGEYDEEEDDDDDNDDNDDAADGDGSSDDSA